MSDAIELEPGLIRADPISLRRLCGATVIFHPPRHGVQVIMCGNWTVGTLKYYANTKHSRIRLEGFEWWRYNRILQCDRWNELVGFDRMAEARKLAVKALKLAGAEVVFA